MSRLQSFLINEIYNFGEIVKMLQSRCKPFLLELKSCKGFLYRGQFSRTIPDIEEVKPRTNRKPRNTPQEIHSIWDGEFKKKFGWKARSEGVFVTSDAVMAENFGRLYLFFPIGPYKYVWSDKYMDVTNDMDREIYEYFYDKERNSELSLNRIWHESTGGRLNRDEKVFQKWKEDNIGRIDKVMIKACKSVVDNYIDDDMSWAILQGNEMTFKCKSYYLVNRMFEDDMKVMLL
jgi:hypothetical protein